MHIARWLRDAWAREQGWCPLTVCCVRDLRHVEEVFAPVEAEKRPASHAVQEVAAQLTWNFPGSHGVHVAPGARKASKGAVSGRRRRQHAAGGATPWRDSHAVEANELVGAARQKAAVRN